MHPGSVDAGAVDKGLRSLSFAEPGATDRGRVRIGGRHAQRAGRGASAGAGVGAFFHRLADRREHQGLHGRAQAGFRRCVVVEQEHHVGV